MLLTPGEGRTSIHASAICCSVSLLFFDNTAKRLAAFCICEPFKLNLALNIAVSIRLITTTSSLL